MDEYEGLNILTARQAQRIAIKANKGKINEVLKQIEEAAKSGESKIILIDTPNVVLQYLKNLDYKFECIGFDNDGLGNEINIKFKISW